MILAGDFNTWNEGRRDTVERITTRLRLKEVLLEPDHRSDLGSRSISVCPGLQPVHARAIEVRSSDHNPESDPASTTLRLASCRPPSRCGSAADGDFLAFALGLRRRPRVLTLVANGYPCQPRCARCRRDRAAARVRRALVVHRPCAAPTNPTARAHALIWSPVPSCAQPFPAPTNSCVESPARAA